MSFPREKKKYLLDTLIGSLLFQELRDLYKEAYNVEQIPQEHNSFDKLPNLIKNSGLSKAKLVASIHNLERKKPFRHIFFTRMIGNFSEIIKKSVNLKENFNKSENAGFNFIFESSYIDKDEVTFTFSHDAQSTLWTWKNGGKFPETKTIRHPIIVKFIEKGNLVLATLPGYTQERSKNKINYFEIIDSLLKNISQNFFEIDYKPFLTKKVIDTLLKFDTNRASFVHLNSKNSKGGLQLTSLTKTWSIENLLPSMMIPHLPANLQITEDQLKSALIAAIKDCDVNDSIIYWSEQDIVTKVTHFNYFSELFITWGGSKKSYSLVMPIIYLFSNISEKFETQSHTLLNFFIENRERKTVFTIEDISASISLPSNVLEKELVNLATERLIELRYRLNTKRRVLDLDNDWTDNPIKLNQVFELDNHDFFDGSIPNNIEVAFALTSRSSDK